MHWSPDVSDGAWLRDPAALAPGPGGFAAAARLPHALLSDGSRDEGRLDAGRLAAVAAHLAAHTATPEAVFAAVWDGWGGLVGEDALPGAVADVDAGDDPQTAARHAAMLRHSIRDPFNNVFRRPAWEPGILSDEISRGPRLEVGSHGYVLFRGTIAAWRDPAWPGAVPWADPDPQWTASPGLLWPSDRAWLLITGIDATATLVSGSAALIRDLLDDPDVGAEAVAG